MKKFILPIITLSMGITTVLAQTSETASQAPVTLIVKKYPLTVDGRKTMVYRIEQPNGEWGYHGIIGQDFDVTVKNQTDVPTTLHWHGLIVPNNQDGVPYVTQQPIPPGGEYHYHFKLVQSGTYWMHSHFGMQVQQYLSAPLILADSEEKSSDKEVVLFLADYSKKSPEAILQALKNSGNKMANMDMPANSAQPDLNDVHYDAYLTNYRTLNNPEIVNVKPGETVRLRIIDGAAATNFWINTGILPAQAIAMDGEPIQPFSNSLFQIAMGQRIDLKIKLPDRPGVYPILAQGEGTNMQTGLILATANAPIPKLSEQAQQLAPALNYEQESHLVAMQPLPKRRVQQVLHLSLQGDMVHYVWKINGQVWPKVTPSLIKPHHRIEIIFDNQTNMAHPMHLHGHVFEVTAINGKPIKNGARRDTVLVLPHSTVAIQFDANNPGHWMLHCHMLYHQETGTMTLVDYEMRR